MVVVNELQQAAAESWGLPLDAEPPACDVVVRLPQRRTAWTAAELIAATFPPPRWAVPGVVAEGLNLLVSPPKVGKSWMALGVAVAVASGGKALGKVDVDPGDVLYLALEDTARRLQNRLRVVLGKSGPPSRLTIATACEPMTEGGDRRIAAWLEAHPEARLVIVDVFAKVRGPVDRRSSAYDADYQAIGTIKALADRYGVAFLVVHHTRKAGAEDFLDTISGTQGIAGAADAVLVLSRSRGKSDATLRITGRDVEEADYALDFAPDRGLWTLLDGPAADYELGDTRRSILRLLRDQGPMTPKQIGEALGIEANTAKLTAWRMSNDGQLDVAEGVYAPPVTGNPCNPVTQDHIPGYSVTAVTGYTDTPEGESA